MLIHLLLVVSVSSQEVTTPSSRLRPRDRNHHAFDTARLLNSFTIEPTKQGPVLFPNDAPPPPRPPLIVTARPLIESIARSELGQTQNNNNNTETSQSQVNGQRVSFVPYLSRVSDYRPYNPSPTFNYNLPTQIPYADVVKKTRLNSLERDNRYNDYEEQTVLPPIYRALSDHAQDKVLKLKKLPNFYKAPLPDYQNYQDNNINDKNTEYDQNQNYAFSYTVKDQKTGDDFSHSQHSSGSATNGEYRVRLPDGRMQIVSYTADENGYKADVRYDEENTNGNSIDNNYIDYGQNKHTDYGNNKHNDHVKHNDYIDRNNNIGGNGYVAGNNNEYVDRNNDNVYKYNDNSYVRSENVDYTDRSLKDYTERIKPVERDDYYHYPDVSREYNDYSSEYNSNYEPHRSKYSTYLNNENVDVTNRGTASTVKPSYEELKPLFVTKNYNQKELAIPSTTPSYSTSERVVVIGGKSPNLYTDIKSSIPSSNLVSYPTPRVILATTPNSYLVSTIASLKNKVHLAAKPILSDRFIDKINKYLSFN